MPAFRSHAVIQKIHPLLRKLEGGDRRSIGRANEVAQEVLADPGLLSVLFDGMRSPDPVVRMRSADAAEKVTAERPGDLGCYKALLLTSLAEHSQKEVRWHVALMIGRLDMDGRERERAVSVLLGYMSDPSSIVKTCAMQALADIAARDPALRPVVRLHLRELVVIGTPAMKARGRLLLEGLASLA